MFSKVNERWRDGMQAGSRTPRLLVVVPSGAVAVFEGRTIPGAVVVTGSSYNKNGKWSSTTYQFRCADGVVLVESLTPMHQRPFDSFAAWAEVHATFEATAGRAVDPASMEAALRAAYTRGGDPHPALGELDERQAAVAALSAPCSVKAPGVRWMLNAFSLSMVTLPATVRCREVDAPEAARLAVGAESAVGHADTARVFASLLGCDVAYNRATVTLALGESALVGQLSGPRLPEGTTTLPEGATIRWIVVEVS